MPVADKHKPQGHSLTFVLVHGSGHGSWCWRRVANPLRAQGHRVFTPTLTGLGERAHLLSPSVNLDMHCRDVMSLISCEEIEDVVLVGHSYAGIIISLVADRMPNPLRHLVYLDAQVPKDGESWADRQPDLAPHRIKAAYAYTAERGLATPVIQFTPPFDTGRAMGLRDPADIEWVNRRISDHPLATYMQPAFLTNAVGNGIPKTYVSCTGETLAIFDPIKRRVRDDADWSYTEIDACHDCMVSSPDDVVQALLTAAASG
jgi:pimeloyl-ACP methyl ester carboxylesterase